MYFFLKNNTCVYESSWIVNIELQLHVAVATQIKTDSGT